MPKNQDKKQNKKQDKKQQKRAALFYWSHSIYVAAEKASRAVGGFSKQRDAGARFYCVVTKMKAFIAELNEVAATKECAGAEIKRVQAAAAQKVERLEAAAAERVERAQAEGVQRREAAPVSEAAQEYLCSMDRECPDGQICIYGTCESPFA